MAYVTDILKQFFCMISMSYETVNDCKMQLEVGKVFYLPNFPRIPKRFTPSALINAPVFFILVAPLFIIPVFIAPALIAPSICYPCIYHSKYLLSKKSFEIPVLKQTK